MANYYRNEYLFSEIYLQEITQQPEDTEILASLTTLKDYREWTSSSPISRKIPKTSAREIGFIDILSRSSLRIANTKQEFGWSVRLNDNGLKRAYFSALFFQGDVVFVSS